MAIFHLILLVASRGTGITNVSLAGSAGPPLGFVSPENEPCIREALEEEVLFASVVLHIA